MGSSSLSSNDRRPPALNFRQFFFPTIFNLPKFAYFLCFLLSIPLQNFSHVYQDGQSQAFCRPKARNVSCTICRSIITPLWPAPRIC